MLDSGSRHERRNPGTQEARHRVTIETAVTPTSAPLLVLALSSSCTPRQAKTSDREAGGARQHRRRRHEAGEAGGDREGRGGGHHAWRILQSGVTIAPVFQGGPGGWELVGRVSYIDLDSGSLAGGRFWRLTPMVNWSLSDHVRLEMTYGYAALDRFDLEGKTHFFQRVFNCSCKAA